GSSRRRRTPPFHAKSSIDDQEEKQRLKTRLRQALDARQTIVAAPAGSFFRSGSWAFLRPVPFQPHDVPAASRRAVLHESACLKAGNEAHERHAARQMECREVAAEPGFD